MFWVGESMSLDISVFEKPLFKPYCTWLLQGYAEIWKVWATSQSFYKNEEEWTNSKGKHLQRYFHLYVFCKWLFLDPWLNESLTLAWDCSSCQSFLGGRKCQWSYWGSQGYGTKRSSWICQCLLRTSLLFMLQWEVARCISRGRFTVNIFNLLI